MSKYLGKWIINDRTQCFYIWVHSVYLETTTMGDYICVSYCRMIGPSQVSEKEYPMELNELLARFSQVKKDV
jgi:hypothetical protein